MNHSPPLIYESNPKHSEPWQRGRKGSICDQAVRPHATSLLNNSEPDRDRRFAIFQGRAYCAREHQAGKWHGYPVGWKEVPSRIRRIWRDSGKLQNRENTHVGSSMINGFSREFGDQSKFFIKLTFISDPDEGAGASPQLAATWGSFEIWVNGINLCMHQEAGGQLPAVHWYLLPMIRWFVRNWDVLLHEERLPNRNEPQDAWHALQRNREAPSALSPDDTSAWEDAHDDWWSRHALLACREGGLFPDVIIRRKRDAIEFSWGQSPLSGRPKHYSFVSGRDCACIPPEFVAEPLAAALGAAIQHLCSEMPEEPEFSSLRDEFQKLQNVDSTNRPEGPTNGPR